MRSKLVEKNPEKRFLITTISPFCTSRPFTSFAPASLTKQNDVWIKQCCLTREQRSKNGQGTGCCNDEQANKREG
eukprot:scaffold283665_cov23-Tisochrysis_lutea.AAC.1